jgi:hypothetical protein
MFVFNDAPKLRFGCVYVYFKVAPKLRFLLIASLQDNEVAMRHCISNAEIKRRPRFAAPT